MPNNATDLHRSTIPVDTAPRPVNPAGRAVAGDTADAGLVEEEVLIEEISIDGMCGVY